MIAYLGITTSMLQCDLYQGACRSCRRWDLFPHLYLQRRGHGGGRGETRKELELAYALLFCSGFRAKVLVDSKGAGD